MRDFELEKLADEDIVTALKYIGKTARHKNLFLGNNSKTRLTPNNPKNPKSLTESIPCL